MSFAQEINSQGGGTKSKGQIVTFYSYKGGVGRSRALANVAYQLAERGRKVLCIDFDLDAPGLSCYFEKWLTGNSNKNVEEHYGIIDLFNSYKKYVLSKNPFTEIIDIGELTQKVVVRSKTKFEFDFIGPGKQDAQYGQRVTGFDWDSFYYYWDGGRFVEHLRMQLMKKYDYVLIDSRTGISDIGGICTIQLPTILIGVFTPFRQSMMGLEKMIKIILKQRDRLERNEPLAVIPLPARVERSFETKKYEEWFSKLVNSSLGKFFLSALPPRYNLEQILQDIMLLYYPIYSYTDDLESAKESRSEKIVNAWKYSNLVNLLEYSFAKFGLPKDHLRRFTLNEAEKVSMDSFNENIESYKLYPRDKLFKTQMSPSNLIL